MAKTSPKKTTSTHPLVFLNHGKQYSDAADILAKHSESSRRGELSIDMPIYFLYAHSIELLLKAFNRISQPSVGMGHNLMDLYKEARKTGLIIKGVDDIFIYNVIEYMNPVRNSHAFRYSTEKPLNRPEISVAQEFVKLLYEAVSAHEDVMEKVSGKGTGRIDMIFSFPKE